MRVKMPTIVRPRRICRHALLAAALAAAPPASLAFGAVPHAPRARIAARTLEVRPAHVHLGGRIVLEGHGFPARGRVALLAGRRHHAAVRVGAAVAGRDGGFVAPIRIHAHASPGLYVMTACLDRCRVRTTTRFRVLAP
jgi:hypothetical protein